MEVLRVAGGWFGGVLMKEVEGWKAGWEGEVGKVGRQAMWSG